jgi:putative hydrolase of the HAD superfamily
VPDPVRTRIQAVTFDAGGTLVEPWPSVGHVYAEIANRHGLPGIAPQLLTQSFAKAWKARKDFGYSIPEWEGIVAETFATITGAKPDAALFDDLYRRFAEPDAWRVFDDVFPTMEALRRRGLRLAVISNWDTRLIPLLNAIGLSKVVEFVVVSAETGFHKPSVEIFHHAAKRFGLPPETILHVGDSEQEDVNGARAAGFEAIRIARRDLTANSAIRSLTEIEKRLDSL